MEHKLMKRAAIWCLCFCVASMGIMTYLSFKKNVLPSETEPVSAKAREKGADSEDGTEAKAETEKEKEGSENDDGG